MGNGRIAVLVVLAMGLCLVTATMATAAVERVPVARTTEANTLRGATITDNGEVFWTKQAAPGDTVWIRVHDDARCDETGLPTDGGQGTGDAPGYGTWCWENGYLGGGLYDSCSSTIVYGGGRPGCFNHFDIYSLVTNQWHLDTWMAYTDGSEPDSTPWCGEFGDTLIWKNDWGYGPTYNFSLVLNLGMSGGPGNFNAADGFTIGGVHMYDVEINYDYCYLEYTVTNDINTALWTEIPGGRFNGTCNPEPEISCPGTGGGRYGCAQYDALGPFYVDGVDNSSAELLIRWRFASDQAWDDEDASGGVHTDGAWRVDHVQVLGRNDGITNSTYPFNDVTRSTFEDFESGMGAEWTTPNLPQAQVGGYWSGGVWVNGTPVWTDWWHLELDPSYANYGNTCTYSNNWMWVADDEARLQNAEDSYHYRLTTPVFECGQNNPYWDPNGDGPGTPDNIWTGVVVETDEYLCIKDVPKDVTDTQLRVYNNETDRWSQWLGDDVVIVGGCQFWNVDQNETWSRFLGASIDSIQFSWEFLDQCDYNAASELPCMGAHRKSTYIVDNVSVGIFEARNTQFSQGASNRFNDTFDRAVPLHPLFKENWELSAGDVWEQEDSLTLEARDADGLILGTPPLNSGVKIHWRVSTDCGQTWDKESSRPRGSTLEPAVAWNQKTLNFSAPDDDEATGTTARNGVYQTIISPGECGFALWPEGTVVEYFYSAEDLGGDIDTAPNRLALLRNSLDLVETTPGREYDRRYGWPFEAQVLPCPTSKDALPAQQNHSVLLVDSYGLGRATFDIESDPDLSQDDIEAFPDVFQIYQEGLDRLGIQYDFYRESYGVSRSGAAIYSNPFDHDNYGGVLDHTGAVARRYNTVIYIFGEFNSWTVVDSAQLEAAVYLDPDGITFPDSANLWIIGDDLCEDAGLTDPVWENDQGAQTTAGANFWVNLVGMTAVTDGCTKDAGHGNPTIGYRHYIAGKAGTVLSGITKATGYWDCPIREHPDDEATVDTATELMEYSDDGSTAMTYKRHTSGSKVVMSFVGLENICTSQERDCIMQAILGPNGFNVGIPNPRSNCAISVDVPGSVPGTDRLVLHQNRPNPFNPVTDIKFNIPADTKVSLKIYDIAGREVKTLVQENRPAGEYTVQWTGVDNRGRDVTSGVYFYRLDAGKETLTKKMVLLR